jgi:hypothetical protein
MKDSLGKVSIDNNLQNRSEGLFLQFAFRKKVFGKNERWILKEQYSDDPPCLDKTKIFFLHCSIFMLIINALRLLWVATLTVKYTAIPSSECVLVIRKGSIKFVSVQKSRPFFTRVSESNGNSEKKNDEREN